MWVPTSQHGAAMAGADDSHVLPATARLGPGLQGIAGHCCAGCNTRMPTAHTAMGTAVDGAYHKGESGDALTIKVRVVMRLPSR